MKTLKYWETTLSKPSYSMLIVFVCLNLLAYTSNPSNSRHIHFESGSLHSTFVHVLEILKHDHVMKSTILWIPCAYVCSVCLITSIKISIFLICKLIDWTWVNYGFIFRIGCAMNCRVTFWCEFLTPLNWKHEMPKKIMDIIAGKSILMLTQFLQMPWLNPKH